MGYSWKEMEEFKGLISKKCSLCFLVENVGKLRLLGVKVYVGKKVLGEYSDVFIYSRGLGDKVILGGRK